MNELFVNVKVDREERPDVDAIYMEAVQAMTGQGGWPMTVFLHARRPAVLRRHLLPQGGPRRHARLRRAAASASTRCGAPAATTSSSRPTSSPRRSAGRRSCRPGDDLPGADVARRGAYADAGRAATTPTWGGFGGAPKFPQTDEPRAAAARTTPHNGAAETLAMVDHLARRHGRRAASTTTSAAASPATRSTSEWLVPHFEKMLYDQALLARVYLHAWQVTGEAALPPGARRDHRLRAARPAPPRRRLLLGRGRRLARGVEEGRFYVWTPDEVRERARRPTPTPRVEWWGVTDGRQLRGPQHPEPPGRAATWSGPPTIERARRRAVRRPRAARSRPGLDDKVLTEWNGLMLAAAGRGGRRHRQRTTGSTPPSPDGRVPARATCGAPTAAGCARGRPTATARRAEHLAYAADHARARRRLHPPGRGHRRGPLDRRGPRRPPTPCSTCSGTTSAAACSPPAHDAEALVTRPKDLHGQRHPVGQQPGRGRAAAPGRRSPATRRYPSAAEAILRLLGRAGRPAPDGLRPPARPPLDLWRSGTTEIVVVGDRPDLVRGRRRAATCPTRCWPGASPTRHRCGTTATTAPTAPARPTSAATSPASAR